MISIWEIGWIGTKRIPIPTIPDNKKFRFPKKSELFCGPSVEIRTRDLLKPIRDVIPKKFGIYAYFGITTIFLLPNIYQFFRYFHILFIFCTTITD